LKKIIIPSLIVTACIVALLIFTWIYPFSFLNLSKELSYKSDPVVVKEYTNDLTIFKKKYSLNDTDTTDFTTKQTIRILSQKWLTRDKVNISKEQLIKQINDIQNKKKALQLLLNKNSNYTSQTKDFLKLLISNLNSVEKQSIKLVNINFGLFVIFCGLRTIPVVG
jgi:hypothetical protein